VSACECRRAQKETAETSIGPGRLHLDNFERCQLPQPFHRLTGQLVVTLSVDRRRVGAGDSSGYPMPIGRAYQFGKTADGLVLWALRVNGADVPGRFIIVDGRFIQVEAGDISPNAGGLDAR
jgi:hypothetical protein